LNPAGSAGSMEPEGAVKIFSRFEATRNLRYIDYLGDGDSASFLKVKESSLSHMGKILSPKVNVLGTSKSELVLDCVSFAFSTKERNYLMINLLLEKMD